MKKYIKDNNIQYANHIVVTIDGITYINPTEKQILADGWVEYVSTEYEPTLEDIKNQKISEIDTYDTSSNVNSFMLDGEQVWLDKHTRVGLMNSTK